MNVGMTCEECQKDEVGRGLPPHRLAAGEGDEADEHDAQAGPVHPHVPLHVPAHTSILVKHHYLSYMQCCGAGPFSSGSGYFFRLSGSSSPKQQAFNQCGGSKYIEFGSASRILAQFGSGVIPVLLIVKEKILNNFRGKSFSLKQVNIFFNYKHIPVLSHKVIFNQLSL